MSEWNTFLEGLKPYMEPREIFQINNIYNAGEKLLQKGIIGYGKYPKLEEIFKNMKMEILLKIVREHSK